MTSRSVFSFTFCFLLIALATLEVFAFALHRQHQEERVLSRAPAVVVITLPNGKHIDCATYSTGITCDWNGFNSGP